MFGNYSGQKDVLEFGCKNKRTKIIRIIFCEKIKKKQLKPKVSRQLFSESKYYNVIQSNIRDKWLKKKIQSVTIQLNLISYILTIKELPLWSYCSGTIEYELHY